MNRWTCSLAGLTSLALTTAAIACPLCKDAIPNSDAQAAGSVPGGFNFSVYYMLGSLFCVIAGFGFFLLRTIRSTDRLAQAGGFPAQVKSDRSDTQL